MWKLFKRPKYIFLWMLFWFWPCPLFLDLIVWPIACFLILILPSQCVVVLGILSTHMYSPESFCLTQQHFYKKKRSNSRLQSDISKKHVLVGKFWEHVVHCVSFCITPPSAELPFQHQYSPHIIFFTCTAFTTDVFNKFTGRNQYNALFLFVYLICLLFLLFCYRYDYE